MIYAISACLAGENCKYNGGNNLKDSIKEKIAEIQENNNFVLICPETMGGLPSPREPAEIQDGSGKDVLEGNAKVVDKNGKDLSRNFIRGAYASLNSIVDAADEGEEIIALLKAKSPSCGCGQIYDGSFSETLKEGDGVTAALFRKKGIKLMTEMEL